MKPFKQSTFNLLRIVAFAMYFVALAACHKTQNPTIVGKWETVQALGNKWEYEFKPDGQMCRRLPDVFGTTAFCYDYQSDNAVITINANTVEIWTVEFVCDDVIDALVTLPDGDKQRLILKRI